MDLETRHGLISDVHWRTDRRYKLAFGVGPDGELWHCRDPELSTGYWSRASADSLMAWHVDGVHVIREELS